MRLLTLALFLLAANLCYAESKKKDYKLKKPKITKFDFVKGSILKGETPAAIDLFVVARQPTKHKRLYTYRKNFRKKIQRAISDL